MAPRANTQGTAPVRSFRAEDLQQLLSIVESPCVSIYMTTHRRHPEWKQDPIRFRTLLSQAEAELTTRGGARQGSGLLDPLRRLLEDEELWQHSLDGLALFSSPSFAAAYRVPIPVPESVFVSETFHTKPLFQFLRANRRYFVLAVSQNIVSMYEGNSFGAEAVELRGLPADLTEALGVSELDEHERGMAAHGGGPAGRIFHGRGPGKEDRKEMLLKYFRAIDKGLHEFLRQERAPLLLAAVKYYHSIYREASTYPHLLDENLDGNFDRVNGDQIHAAAWPIVSVAFERQAAEWVDRYRSFESKGLALDGVQEVASATVEGRVRCILAAEDGNVWGHLDRATGQVERREQPTDKDDGDLIDDICEEAWKRGAEVLVLPRTALPTKSPIAAVLRF